MTQFAQAPVRARAPVPIAVLGAAMFLGATTLGALAVAGCEETGLRPFADASTEQDGASQGLTSYQYTPVGCGYEVSTPEVREAGAEEAVFGEGAFVDHVHVGWPGASHLDLAVNWRSDDNTLSSRLLLGTDRDAVDAAEGEAEGVAQHVGHQLFYATTLLGTATGSARIHEVHACGLQPDTRYFYKVGGEDHWSAVHETTTAPEPGPDHSFSFGATGDSRNQQENAWALTQLRFDERQVDFELFSGDAVFQGTIQGEWNQFFEASADDFSVQDFLARVPLMAANGNHDALAVPYVSQFSFPQELTPGEFAQGEQWYSFDYGSAHFVMLDDSEISPAQLGAQTGWLRADLKAVDRSKTPWIFVTHHRPFYTCLSNHKPDTALRATWQPVFDEYGVDIVFTGHNHVYERSRPIKGLEDGQGQLAPAGANGVPTFSGTHLRPSGTLYIVSAGAGAPLYGVSDECPTTERAESVRHYGIVEVDGLDLRFTVYNVLNDAEVDAIAYSKSAQ